METQSLTRQTGILIILQVLSMPLAFIVPIVLVRYLTMAEFGYYKQLLLIFYIMITVIEFGFTNSLLYFIPKTPEKGKVIISNSLLIQLVLGMCIVLFFFVFKHDIASFFKNGQELESYLPYIIMFAYFWVISENFYNLLIIEKKAFSGGVFSFLSQSGRSIITIIVVLLGMKIAGVMLALIAIGIFRIIAMGWYLIRKYGFFVTSIDRDLLLSQISYSAPLAFAMIMRSLSEYSHQFIVSFYVDPEKFAIYSIGCFQLVILSTALNSISRVSVVKIVELKASKNTYGIISILDNSIRKLWLLFMPMFIFLFIYSEEIITLLYTSEYIDSVPIFRIFLLIIPISVLFVDYIPRAFAETKFMFKNNFMLTICSVALIIPLLLKFGLFGAATGFIIAKVFWKAALIAKCKQLLKVNIRKFIPVKTILNITYKTAIAGCLTYLLNVYCLRLLNIPMQLIISFALFSTLCFFFYWYFDILIQAEKEKIVVYRNKYLSLIFK